MHLQHAYFFLFWGVCGAGRTTYAPPVLAPTPQFSGGRAGNKKLLRLPFEPELHVAGCDAGLLQASAPSLTGQAEGGQGVFRPWPNSAHVQDKAIPANAGRVPVLAYGPTPSTRPRSRGAEPR